jgi:hypothetical protein
MYYIQKKYKSWRGRMSPSPLQISLWVLAAIRYLRESAHDGARVYFDYKVTRTTQAVGYTVGYRYALSLVLSTISLALAAFRDDEPDGIRR